MKTLYSSRITRRATLQWLAAAMAASNALPHALAATKKAAAQATIPRGYGTDPDLNNPTVPWARAMTKQQLQLTAVIADLILPGTASAPAPSVIGIPDFVDEWVSAPYPEQQTDRTIILNGLQWSDAEANRLWQRAFLEIGDNQQRQIIDAMVPKGNGAAATPQETFFRRLRFIVVGAYYTTPEGFKDIGYIGNVPLPSYPPVTEHERRVLDAELRKLGI